jgi:hypothetical protein
LIRRIKIKKQIKTTEYFLKTTGPTSPLQLIINKNIIEPRKRPQIPIVKLFLAYSLSPYFGCKSLNELDSFLQTNEAKILFSSEQRDRVVSESLIRKVFSEINPQDIKKTLIEYAKYLSSKGAFKGMKGHTILSVGWLCLLEADMEYGCRYVVVTLV